MSGESPAPDLKKKKKTLLKNLYGMWKEKNLTFRNTVSMLKTGYHIRNYQFILFSISS